MSDEARRTGETGFPKTGSLVFQHLHRSIVIAANMWVEVLMNSIMVRITISKDNLGLMGSDRIDLTSPQRLGYHDLQGVRFS
jgi:hypothetical protein